MFGNPEHATGGRALKYYASVRLEVRRTESLKQDGVVIGNRVRVKVVKNKIAAPFKEVEFDIMFGKGISVEGDILDRAVEKGIVDKYYSKYSYKSKLIGQCRPEAINYLMVHSKIAEEIAERLKEMYIST